MNALTDFKAADVSSKPGMTQTINWFRVRNNLILVDLPGYGFAYANEDKKTRWMQAIKDYFAYRKTLKRVILLLDARHPPKGSDFEIMDLIQQYLFLYSISSFISFSRSKQRFQIVLTKTDEVYAEDLARRYQEVLNSVGSYHALIPRVMMVSSKYKKGISVLRKELFQLRLH